jgi:hypothetical protein
MLGRERVKERGVVQVKGLAEVEEWLADIAGDCEYMKVDAGKSEDENPDDGSGRGGDTPDEGVFAIQYPGVGAENKRDLSLA